MSGTATFYHDSLAGNTLGCNGYGTYDPANPYIIAVGPAQYDTWPCGTALEVCSENGDSACLTGMRVDSCPGCGSGHIDLSRTGYEQVCSQAAGVCRVRIRIAW